ncbi:Retrovirus-related Pol polyprotein from transposon opus, partial [Mucuna pruriens]
MISILSVLLEDCMEVFMDDITVYVESFDSCMDNLSWVLCKCIDSNLITNFEKCPSMVTEGIVLGHLISSRGIKVDKAKVDVIASLSNLASVREVQSFLGHQDHSAPIHASIEEHGYFIRPALRGCFPGAKEETHVRTYPSSIELESASNHKSSPIHLEPWIRDRSTIPLRKRSFWQSVEVSAEEAEREVEIDLVDAALQEFDVEIRDKKGVENAVANHLSQLEREVDPLPIRDEFLDEQIL